MDLNWLTSDKPGLLISSLSISAFVLLRPFVPLVAKKIGVQDCKGLIDKVKAKIHDWKNKSLSYAGRAQLIAYVLASIQVYWASVFKLPKSVNKDVKRIFKAFL
ncbi:hypothetical protein Tco_0517688 [Tanacetum coccineum]